MHFKIKWSIALIILTLALLKLVYNIGPKDYDLMLNPKKAVPPSPLYFLKITREHFASKFVFGDEETCNWNFILAQKRISEARSLEARGLDKLAAQQIKLASNYQAKATSILDTLKDKVDINYLIELQTDNQKQLGELVKVG